MVEIERISSGWRLLAKISGDGIRWSSQRILGGWQRARSVWRGGAEREGTEARIAAGCPLVSILGRRRKRYANGFLRGELSSATKRRGEQEEDTRWGCAERDAVWNQSAVRLAPPRAAPRDRPRGRIIFTEIKSKIRLALKCAPDRARLESPVAQPRSNTEREREGGEDKKRGSNRERQREMRSSGTTDRQRRKESAQRASGGLNRRNSLLMQIRDSRQAARVDRDCTS